ncbi:MAG: hypothetical protein ACTS5R_02330 [Candidatus Hodgkinia cicadicola]
MRSRSRPKQINCPAKEASATEHATNDGGEGKRTFEGKTTKGRKSIEEKALKGNACLAVVSRRSNRSCGAPSSVLYRRKRSVMNEERGRAEEIAHPAHIASIERTSALPRFSPSFDEWNEGTDTIGEGVERSRGTHR